jgi:arylsulfatase
VIDVTPTILDIAGIKAPAQVRGISQQPMDGISMRYTFHDGAAEGRRHTQHYEMWGNRGLWHEGWMAICRLQPDAPGAYPHAPITVPFDDLPWELYNHQSDPTECVDLAATEPQRLRALIDTWWAAAGRYDVLPVDIRPRSERWPTNPPSPAGSAHGYTAFLGAGGPYERGVAPRIAGRSFDLVADIVVVTDATGALYALGGRHGGYCWYLTPDEMCFEVATSSVDSETVRSAVCLGAGAHRLEARVAVDASLRAVIEFLVDGARVGVGDVSSVLKRVPIGSGRTYVGRAPSGTVGAAFDPPFAFTGVLNRLTVTPRAVEAEPSPHQELVAEMREQ